MPRRVYPSFRFAEQRSPSREKHLRPREGDLLDAKPSEYCSIAQMLEAW